MSLEEKIGQMLMVHFRGEKINHDAKRLIDEAYVGGFIYYNFCNGNLPMGIAADLSAQLQNYSQTPLLIAVDHEGGRVQHLKDGFTLLPAPSTMSQPLEMGSLCGFELRCAGVNLNLAPVVEPYLNDRSQNNPKAFIAGMKKSGLLSCAKHYPGHGKGTVDSHFGLPVCNELEPFSISGADLVMTAHVLVPDVDPDKCATLSKIWIQRLREKFDGCVVTDSLTMAGVLQNAGSLKKAALEAINAGVDILLVGGKKLTGSIEVITPDEIIDLHQYLVQRTLAGKIDEALIDQAVARIQKLKAKIW